MADEFTYTNYSVEDIERYLGGRMNAKDMHDIERAALQDPFLADAIEGFQHQPFAQTYQHLDEIAIAIQGEKESAKVVPLPVKRNYWWRAAVVVGCVVIAGAALWHVQNNNVAKSKTIAVVVAPEKPEPVQASPSSTVANSDTVREPATTTSKKSMTAAGRTTVGTNNTLVAENSQTGIQLKPGTVTEDYDTIKGNPLIRAAAPAIAAAKAPAADFLKQIPSVNVDKDGNIKQDTALDKKLTGVIASVNVNTYTNNATIVIKRTGPTDNELNIVANNASNNVLLNNVLSKNKSFATVPAKFEGFVVDDKNQPVADVTIYSNDKKHVTLTDSKGYFMLNTGDSQLAVQVASAGYYTKQAQLKPNTPSYIIINQETSALAGVVVTEFKNTQLSKKMPVDSLFPEGGWQSFREYVYKKLHKEKDMDTTGAVITVLGRSVEIEFVVDENGLAKDLKITKSLNDDSDAKALEVVQQWPHWIATKKDRKGKVVIQF